jgi:hypothetical protein
VWIEKKVKTLEGRNGERKVAVSTLKEDLEKQVMAAEGEAISIGYQWALVVLWSWGLSYGLALWLCLVLERQGSCETSVIEIYDPNNGQSTV